MKLAQIGCLALVGIIGLIAFGGLGGGESGAPAAIKPAQVATARELAEAFQLNEIAAKSRFEGAPITISGRLYEIQSGRDSPLYIFRDGTIGAKGVPGEVNAAAGLRAGQSVILQCETVMYVLGYVTPQGCRIAQTRKRK